MAANGRRHEDLEPPEATLHFFRATDNNGVEVPFEPTQVLLEALVAAGAGRGAQVAIVDSGFPAFAALGQLPAGYIGGRRAKREVLSFLARHRVWRPANYWAPYIDSVLGNVVDAVLWLHQPCARQHTRPAVLRSTSLAGRPLAMLSCRWRAQAALARCGGGDGVGSLCERRRHAVERVGRSFADFLAQVPQYLAERADEVRGGELRIEDLVLYAHARVLLAVPPALLPWQQAALASDGALSAFAELVRAALERGVAAGPTATWPAGGAAAAAGARCRPLFFGEVEAFLDAWDSDAQGAGVDLLAAARGESAPPPPDDEGKGRTPDAFAARWTAVESAPPRWRNLVEGPDGTERKGAAETAAGAGAPGVAGGSAENGSEKEKDSPEKIARQAALRRANAGFAVWCVASIAALAAWRRYRAQLAS